MRAFTRSALTAAALLLIYMHDATAHDIASRADHAGARSAYAAANAHFPYVSALRSAERGDTGALLKLIQFSIHTDAYGSIAHGLVLLELGDIYGVPMFSSVLARASQADQATAQQEINDAISVLNGPRV
jgi:hypothetical protein